jgi:2,3-dihydroxyphenylpropionate 1,2-dioxygenase
MQALADGPLEALMELTEDGITRDAGLSGHESKTWLIARAALDAQPLARPAPVAMRHYQAIPEYIAGFGILWMPGE